MKWIHFLLLFVAPQISSLSESGTWNPKPETGNYSPLHAIYISYTNMKYEETDGILSARIRMFSNDFEDALRLIGAPQEPGFEEGETPHPEIDDFICAYLGEQFQVWADGQPVHFFFLGKKREADATTVSLMAEDVCSMNELKVHHSVLFELFDEQTNILRVRAFGELKNYNLTKRIPEEEIRYRNNVTDP